MLKRTKRLQPVEVPRLGPPVNLRPAGAHTDKRRKTRAEEKAALRKAAFEFEAARAAASARVCVLKRPVRAASNGRCVRPTPARAAANARCVRPRTRASAKGRR